MPLEIYRAGHHFSQAERPCQLSGMPAFSFQFGRTSTRLPPHLPHFAWR
jgi:hypothetical protein